MSTAQIDEVINNNNRIRFSNNDDKNEVAEWLEELLKNYWAVKEKLQNYKSLNATFEEVTKFPLKLRTVTFHNQNPNAGKSCPNSNDQSATLLLSESVNIEISYTLRQENRNRIQDLVSTQSRLPVALPDGQIYPRALAKKREIEFHTEVIPDLETWALSRGVQVNFGVPHCFYGNLEYLKNGESYTGEHLAHIMETPVIPAANGTEIYTMLLLEDLNKNGYTRKALGSNLTIEEVKEALKQISVMHAVSWAWQTSTKIPIKKKWPIFLNTKRSTELYGVLIKRGLPIMQDILRRYLQNTDSFADMYLVDRLKIIESKIFTLLHTNMIPANFPAPNSIIHLDFQYRNVFFKEKQIEKLSNIGIHDDNNVGQDKTSLDINCVENPAAHLDCTISSNDCRIVNWGLAGIGSPLHDVAFLIFTSLPPDVRRQNTKDILKTYYKSYQAICEKLKVELPFSFSLILSQYSKSFLLAVLLVIGNLRDIDNDSTVDHKSMNVFTEALKDLVTMQMI